MKRVFRSVKNWIIETPAIQPLLIIAIIFGLIFSLTFIKPAADAITGWFDSTPAPKEIKFAEFANRIQLDDDTATAKYEDDYIVMYSNTTCGNCDNFKSKTLGRYLKQKGHFKAYTFEVDTAQEDKEIKDNDDPKLLAVFETILKANTNYTNYYSITKATPLIIYVHDKQIYRVHEGDFSTYDNFRLFVNAERTYTETATETTAS